MSAGRHATAHSLPFSVKAVGFAGLPVCVAWKPMLVEAPAARLPL